MNHVIKKIKIKKETINYEIRTKKDNSGEYARVKFIDNENKKYAMNVNYPLNNNLIEQLETSELPIISAINYSNQYGQWTEIKVPYELNPFNSNKKYLFKNNNLSEKL